MIEQEEFKHYNYIMKEELTGSYLGMRYMLKKKGEGIEVTIWPEPYCYAKTPEEEKTRHEVKSSPDGVEEARKWLNEQYEAQIDRWKNTKFS